MLQVPLCPYGSYGNEYSLTRKMPLLFGTYKQCSSVHCSFSPSNDGLCSYRAKHHTCKCILSAILYIVGGDTDEETVNFFVGFSDNLRYLAYKMEEQLFITTGAPDPVSFTVETLLGFNHSGMVTDDLAYVVSLSHTYQVSHSSDSSKGIRISARSKWVTVYGQNYYKGTADAFLALPCSRQNIEEYVYYGIMFHGEHDLYVGSSQLLIVGCEDNTTVTVASQTITLDMMETYLYARAQDLTGTRVVSNNPISLFSGHECTFIPEGATFCDHLTEQLPNSATWGTHFLTASLAGRNTDDMYRILTSQPSTIVNVTCSTQLQSKVYSLLSAGDWEAIEIPQSNISSYCAIESNKPLLLVQFALSRKTGSNGDPFMMIVPAIEQYDSDYNVYMPPEFSRHFVTVFVTPEYYQPDMIYIDDVSQEGADWAAINCTDTTICGYATYAELPAGTHRLYHAGFRATIGVSVYGFHEKNSYGYPGGLRLFPAASM